MTERAVDALAVHLKNREMLLVLDNLEQVRESAPALVSLLARAPRLKLLVTSRVVLQRQRRAGLPGGPA